MTDETDSINLALKKTQAAYFRDNLLKLITPVNVSVETRTDFVTDFLTHIEIEPETTLKSIRDDFIKQWIKAVHDPPSCPLCNKPLILKTGKKRLFFGCTNYPNCKGSLSYRCLKCEKLAKIVPFYHLCEECEQEEALNDVLQREAH